MYFETTPLGTVGAGVDFFDRGFLGSGFGGLENFSYLCIFFFGMRDCVTARGRLRYGAVHERVAPRIMNQLISDYYASAS